MKYLISLMLLASFLLQGCTENAYTGQKQASKTSIGAGVGAATGALAGVLLGSNAKERRKNALIGAGIGAVGGGGIGYYMDRQETALRDRLRNSGVSVTRDGDSIILNMPGNITFDSNQSSLKPQFFDTLNSVVLVLKEFKNTNIRVDGHTDNVGSDAHNNQLSRERANAVSQYFASQGVDYGRLNAMGYGESRPIASNDSEGGRSSNRRVEIQLTPIQ